MPVLKCGEAVALILLCIFITAYPNECRLQEIHDGGKNLLARQPAQPQVLAELAPNCWQALRKLEHVLVFGALTHLAEFRMVAILFSALHVPSGRLYVPIGFWTNPNIAPGRGNGQRLQAL